MQKQLYSHCAIIFSNQSTKKNRNTFCVSSQKKAFLIKFTLDTIQTTKLGLKSCVLIESVKQCNPPHNIQPRGATGSHHKKYDYLGDYKLETPCHVAYVFQISREQSTLHTKDVERSDTKRRTFHQKGVKVPNEVFDVSDKKTSQYPNQMASSAVAETPPSTNELL